MTRFADGITKDAVSKEQQVTRVKDCYSPAFITANGLAIFTDFREILLLSISICKAKRKVKSDNLYLKGNYFLHF